MKEGDTAVMEFHLMGVTSEEEYEVVKVEKNIVILDTDEDLKRCFKFDSTTGECLNDNTHMGAKRTLKLDKS